MTRASAFSLLQKRTQARTRQCELSILRDPSQSVFAQCMAWAPRLNTFLELKMENERLQHCIHELRAQKGQFVQTPSTSTVPALMASTLPPVFGSNPPSTTPSLSARFLIDPPTINSPRSPRRIGEGLSLRLAWRMGAKLDWVWQIHDLHGRPRDWAVLYGIALNQVCFQHACSCPLYPDPPMEKKQGGKSSHLEVRL